ncbi:hypothetical protein ANDA3_0987 [plant metagenome]|uniref:Histidine kinase n=2 Tax=root TaxID=1 RepID=A0A1C3JWS3_9BURK|nr:hypothetical protein [Orrella dioscoreae]SBT23711.1 hypothetical protein ODI_03739 [Orrella dioscoreae]SOE47688.1 hypothetical protein ODI_R0988 [Orrella dioscoreae]
MTQTQASISDDVRRQAIQFDLLAQVFPVLRHDTVKPVANAKLAVAMLARAVELPPQPDRNDKLTDDVEQMLDDGVDAIRGLGGWFSDTGDFEDLHNVLVECRKLLFTQLLLSGKKIDLPEETDARRIVRVFSSRYVLLACLLATLQAMPEGATLTLAYASNSRLTAQISGGAANTPAPGLADAQVLAKAHGWELEGDTARWSVEVPLIG